MRWKVVALGALALVLTVGAVGVDARARAKTEVFIDKVKVKAGVATYRGHIESKDDDCLKGRTVRLIHDSEPPFVIGEAETDENGDWKIKGPYPSDDDDDSLIVEVDKAKGCKGAEEEDRFYDIPGAPEPR
jgi:hypothetical protein